jgi:formate dehydrogenase alpha subunit
VQKINLTINGKEISTQAGKTVLEVALAAGIYIPTLCYYPDLKPYGACRACVVEIEGLRGLPPSCTTPVAEGMRVRTESEAINLVRKTAIELLIADHPANCLTCSADQHCELQKVAAYLGMREIRLPVKTPSFTVDSSNPFFDLDRNKCILCARCTRACNEITCVGAIEMANRGYATKVATFQDGLLFDSICRSCGECVARCPVGALAPKKSITATAEIETICPYCGVGCSMFLGVRGEQIVSVRGNPQGPANKGKLCVKGRYGIDEFVHHPDRLTTPLIKNSDGQFIPASWDEALTLIASKLNKYQPDQVAVISSARCTNEENYIIQKFTRAVLGTNNIDHCARLCHSPTVAGLAATFGSGAMTNSIGDIEEAACILSIGSNTTSTHPIIGMEMKQAIQRGTRLIVANPREIDLCRDAEIWLRLNPGTDVALLMGMMQVIVQSGLSDSQFIAERTENYQAFIDSLAAFSLDRVEKITGVPRGQIEKAARIFAGSHPAAIFYAMGITQHSHGTDNVMAVSNLALLTGNIGKPGAGVNPLRGQNNVQGACDMGALPGTLPGYQAVDNAEVRHKFEAAWNCQLNPRPGLTLSEIFTAAQQGSLQSIFLLVGENPLLSDPDSQHIQEAIAKLDFVVVQDIFLSETARLAHVVLPAASFAEKDGTFTNTERRIQRVRRAIPPVGQSRADWEIVCAIAQKMGKSGFDYANSSQIWDEVASLTPSYAGISYARLEQGGLQWPCPTIDHPGTPILHTKMFTRGKGKFVPLSYKPALELPDQNYPLILTTERSLFQYHTGTMTRKVKGLNTFRGEELVEINPADAANLGINSGDQLRISSRRGEITAKAKVTAVSPVGVISMSFHFAESPTNRITSPYLDPVAKIPELKVCAVKVEKVTSQ